VLNTVTSFGVEDLLTASTTTILDREVCNQIERSSGPVSRMTLRMRPLHSIFVQGLRKDDRLQ
jgi:hypothetical protein